MTSEWQKRNWFDKSSPRVVCAGSGLLIICIGILSHMTGPQFSCSLLYLIPILLITRVAGFIPGAGASLLAALLWLWADLHVNFNYRPSFTPYWNMVMRLGTFLVAGYLVSAMRSLNAHLEERVIERTSALEAEIVEKRELEKSILEIGDRERAAVGQDLHDGLCQQLVSAAFSANMLHERLADAPARTDIARIGDMIDDAISQARNLARGLYPVRLETEGLEMALRELVSTMSRRFTNGCAFECSGALPAARPGTDIHLYRIAQEAIVNAAKHSGADNVIVSLACGVSSVTLRVEDDGRGIQPDVRNPGGMGLRIMEYRARMIGAEFQIENRSPNGATVRCVVPLEHFQTQT